MLRKRLTSFSVRTLLLLMTILCVALATWGHRARKQRQTVQALQSAGARVTYDYQLAAKGKPPVWLWLFNSLGADYFCDVALVTFYPEPPQEADDLVKLLDGLGAVRQVAIWPGGQGRKTSPAIASGGLTDKGLFHLTSEHPNLAHLSLLHARISPAGFSMLESRPKLVWQIDPYPDETKRPTMREPMRNSRFSKRDSFDPPAGD